MDIGTLSTVYSLNQFQTSWGTAMLSKSLDASQEQGQEIINMINSVSPAQMQQSVMPYLGSNFDVSI